MSDDHTIDPEHVDTLRYAPGAMGNGAKPNGHGGNGKGNGHANGHAGNGSSWQGRKPEIYDAEALRTIKFDPVQQIAGQIIVEGVCLLASKPKLGKTWLMLELALAVAEGGLCWGDIQCPRGDALYLAIEDNRRRMQRRITKIRNSAYLEWPHLQIAHDWPRAHDGGLDFLRRWLDSVFRPLLIVIDVFAAFRRPPAGGRQSGYDYDYDAVHQLQLLCADYPGLAIVLVHHLRKSEGGDDPLDAISGTLGLNAGTDSVLVLNRNGDGLVLGGRGRDIDDVDKAMEFDKETCRWRVLGDREKVHSSSQRELVLAAMRAEGGAMTPGDIASEIDSSHEAVKKLLVRMHRAGEIRKVRRGLYVIPGGRDGGERFNWQDRYDD